MGLRGELWLDGTQATISAVMEFCGGSLRSLRNGSPGFRIPLLAVRKGSSGWAGPLQTGRNEASRSAGGHFSSEGAIPLQQGAIFSPENASCSNHEPHSVLKIPYLLYKSETYSPT